MKLTKTTLTIRGGENPHTVPFVEEKFETIAESVEVLGEVEALRRLNYAHVLIQKLEARKPYFAPLKIGRGKTRGPRG